MGIVGIYNLILMNKMDLIGLFITIVAVGCFSLIFTILYRAYTKSELKDIKSGKKDIDLIDEDIYDNLKNVKRRRKVFGVIKTVLFYLAMMIIIPFFIFSIINKIQGNVTMIGDRGVLVVASGSMSKKHESNLYLTENNLNNQFNKFDMIVIEKVSNPWDLKKYDVISYVNDEGINVIHRIVDIDINTEGEVEFTTRGDANAFEAVDKFRPTIDDIQGRYVNKKIPVIGMFILFMQSSLGMITIIALIYCLLMVDRYTSKITSAGNERLDKLKKAMNFDGDEKIELKANFLETLYYKGYAYKFNENGFIDKEEIKDDEVLKDSNEKIIRVLEDDNNNITSKTTHEIENEGEDE